MSVTQVKSGDAITLVVNVGPDVMEAMPAGRLAASTSNASVGLATDVGAAASKER